MTTPTTPPSSKKPSRIKRTPRPPLVDPPEPPRPAIPQAYWLEKPSGRSQYLIQHNDRWDIQSQSELERRYRLAGLRSKPNKGELTSPVDKELVRVMNDYKIDGTCPSLPGYPPGIKNFGNTRICIRTGIRFPVGVKGDYQFIRDMINAVFGDPLQVALFEGWCLNRYRRISKPKEYNYVGLMLVITGAAGVAKSRIQHDIVTPLLGGSIGDESIPAPDFFDHVLQKEKFTDALMASAHWLAEDVTDKISREADQLAIMRMLKNEVHTQQKTWRPMYSAPFTSQRRVALTLSLNEENDEINKVIPSGVLEKGVADKFLMLRARPNEFPWPNTGDFAEMEEYRNNVMAALPGWIWYLENEYVAPPGHADRRTLIKGWIHRDIQRALMPSASHRLYHAIMDFQDRGGFDSGSIKGPATELYERLGLDLGSNGEWSDRQGKFVPNKFAASLKSLSLDTTLQGCVQKLPDSERRGHERAGWIISRFPESVTVMTRGADYIQQE